MTKPRRGERIIKEPDQKITPKRCHHDNTLNSQQTEDKTHKKGKVNVIPSGAHRLLFSKSSMDSYSLIRQATIYLANFDSKQVLQNA